MTFPQHKKVLKFCPKDSVLKYLQKLLFFSRSNLSVKCADLCALIHGSFILLYTSHFFPYLFTYLFTHVFAELFFCLFHKYQTAVVIVCIILLLYATFKLLFEY